MELFLKTGEPIQGDISLSPLNLMLVFQPNCPGCLTRALPLLEKINREVRGVNCFALSTAFEDYAQNNLKKTTALVSNGELPQASARQFQHLGHKVLPYPITVPVVMDWFVPEETLNAIPAMVLAQLDGGSMSPQMKGRLEAQLRNRFLAELRCGRTFMNNSLQGTPSWFLFRDNFSVLEQWFGHKPDEWVMDMLGRVLAAD